MKHLYLILCSLLLIRASSFAIEPIRMTGDTALCVGTSTSFIDSTPGGVWSISDTSIAKINASGILTSISAGSVTITYSIGLTYANKTVTVHPAALPITGPSVMCVGGRVTLFDATPGGGIWDAGGSSSLGMNTFSSNSATLDGYGFGMGSVSFIDADGCWAFYDVEVLDPYILVPITGNTIIHVGTTTTLHGSSDCVWSSSDPTVATINSVTGTATGISEGTATIQYVYGCAKTTVLTVLSQDAVPTTKRSNKDEIEIYPNPTQKTLTITSTGKVASITITNLLGQAIYTNWYDTERVLVDVSFLAKGVYLIKINGTEVRKFVKE